jgi:hypothetical protein
LAFIARLDLFWLLVGRLVGWLVGWLASYLSVCLAASHLDSSQGFDLFVCICCDEIDNVNVYRMYVCISILMLYINRYSSTVSKSKLLYTIVVIDNAPPLIIAPLRLGISR